MAKGKNKKSKGGGFGRGRFAARKTKPAAKTATKPATPKKRRIVEQAAKPPIDTGDDDEGIDTATTAAAAESAPNGAAPADERGQKTVTRKVLVKLTDEELAAKGREFGETEVAIEAIKTEVSSMNDRKRKLEGHRNKLGHICDAGEEQREMLCNRVEDFTAKEIRIERCDNGEVVEARTMSPQELQGTLDYSAGNGHAANGNGKDDEAEADPPPDSSLRTMADEQNGADDNETGLVDIDDDDFVEDDEADDATGHLNA